MLHRRKFLQYSGLGSLTALATGSACSSPNGQASDTPLFLTGHHEVYVADPRQAALDWFRQAKLGLSVRYGVYAQLERGDYVQFEEKIRPREYAKLKETFNADHFDAGRITDLAIESGAAYVNFSARAPDGFCLFRTNTTAFCSLNSPARRDLVGEMADACRTRGLGLFLSYSYALDWNHPFFYSRDSVQLDWPYARPAYDELPPEYRLEREEDFLFYLKFIDEQLAEILYRYEPLAGLSLYPTMGYYSRPDLFMIEQSYERVREAAPGLLIGFGEGRQRSRRFHDACRRARPEPFGRRSSRGGMGSEPRQAQGNSSPTAARRMGVRSSSRWPAPRCGTGAGGRKASNPLRCKSPAQHRSAAGWPHSPGRRDDFDQPEGAAAGLALGRGPVLDKRPGQVQQALFHGEAANPVGVPGSIPQDLSVTGIDDADGHSRFQAARGLAEQCVHAAENHQVEAAGVTVLGHG